MDKRFESVKRENNYDPISLSRNFERQNTTLSLNNSVNTTSVNSNTQSKLKMILKVYTTEDQRKFIDKSAAYAIKLVNVNAIMGDNQNNFIEITNSQLEVLKNDFEIEYVALTVEAPKKEPIKVFSDGIDYYIETSAAYALGLISVENFNAIGNDLYKISENMLYFLNNKFAVETIILEEEASKKR